MTRRNDKLATYRAKRDFARTPEPAGGPGRPAAPEGRSFVVQKHAARRLHYDFRLELDGVHKSWAVAKGPSLDPADRRLAVQTEDHPLEYGGFEGVIPKGEYGGGTVMLWDRGSWAPEGDARKAYAKGHLKFTLHGEKLKGAWHLVRMARREREKRDNWLLIKSQDEEARPGEGDSLLEEADRSVTTGRSMEAIAAAQDRVWSSEHGEVAPEPPPPAAKPKPARVSGARRAKLPDFVPPVLAKRVETAPSGPDWLHEIKFDGYRALARIDHGAARLLTRSGLDWTDRFRALSQALARLPVETALIDGEVVVMAETGASHFSGLQEALSEGRDDRLQFYAFDLLHLDGKDLTSARLEERKAALEPLIAALGEGPIHYSAHFDADGPEVVSNACRLALEGVVSKKRGSPYRPGRGGEWLKTKCVERQEFVIGGFSKPTTGGKGVGALALGYYREHDLIYAGRVGTGFTEKSGRDLRAKLEKLKRAGNPFRDVPRVQAKGVIWVEPQLVAEIEFQNLTADDMLRHASFQGLREDREPEGVTAERLGPAERPRAAKVPDEAVIAGVKLSHPDRVLYADAGVTKLGLAEYYAEVADWILPHIVKRPLTLVRCPSGAGAQCFYQKHTKPGMPKAIRSIMVPEEGGEQPYVAIDDAAGLISLVQFGALELHPWGSREGRLEQPDRLVFDLDPDPGVPWERIIEAIGEVRDRLAELGLRSFLKTTGGKGLHAVVPIQPKHGWDEVKAFCKAFAEAMAADAPQAYTTNIAKKKRVGRILVDYLRNQRGATAVAPYSSRARPGAPVATPLAWDELSPDLKPGHFTVETLPRRLRSQADDPWAEFFKVRQSLTAKSLRRLGAAA
jgi:bifunctional non-homologous end joining protein LigD